MGGGWVGLAAGTGPLASPGRPEMALTSQEGPPIAWFTRYHRPRRKGLAPGARNHLRQSRTRGLCGIHLSPWLKNEVLILDWRTHQPAYPNGRTCQRLQARRRLESAPEGSAGPPPSPGH